MAAVGQTCSHGALVEPSAHGIRVQYSQPCSTSTHWKRMGRMRENSRLMVSLACSGKYLVIHLSAQAKAQTEQPLHSCGL